MGSGFPAFSELLRRYRLRAGLTQEEVAERAGLSLRGVNALERGERSRPHRDTIRLLGDALDLSTWDRANLEAAARGRSETDSPLAPARNERSSTPVESPVPFVGRRRELDMLEHHIAGRGPHVLMVAGTPGMGKTRILGEAAAQAEARGLLVLRGGCQRRSNQEPYAPVADVLARHLGRLPAGEMHEALKGAQWLLRLLPELGPVMPGKPPPEAAPSGQERRLIFGAATQFFENVSRVADVLLLLDDLQWASADGLDLLSVLARDTASSHIRIVAAYRDTDLQPGDPLALMLADLAQAGAVWQHTLAPLNSDEARHLLTGLLGDVRERDARLTEKVVGQTGGVPFFLVSYAQQTRMTGMELSLSDNVPWNIAHSVRQRIAALPESAQDLLQVAAAIGRQATRTLLAAVADTPEAKVHSALDRACRAQLLVLEGEETYLF